MKIILRLLMFLLAGAGAAAQDRQPAGNSIFEVSEIKTFSPKNIMVQGEVRDPGIVELDRLPLRSAVLKELAIEDGKQVFKGAFFLRGYSLYDILNGKRIKKDPENTFSPPVDMYVVVENDKGEKAVFSWGEIYYRSSFGILISKSIRAIPPVRAKVSWTLPEESRLVCTNDLLNSRFIGNPTKITVKSYHAKISPKSKETYSPEIRIAAKTHSAVIRDIGPSVEKRHYRSVLYGHGMGFKGVLSVSAFCLKDLIAAHFKMAPEDLKTAIAVISARDGYRSVFSASEIMNRNDNQDFLLNDLKDSPEAGRYTLLAFDFFADRNVKSVEKIEFMNIE